MQHNLFARLGALVLAGGSAACAGTVVPPAEAPAAAAPAAAAATPEQAAAFIAESEAELRELSLRSNQAGWVAATYITSDTEALSAEAQKNLNVAIQRRALAARRFDEVQLPAAQRRKLNLLKLALVAPPPGNPEEASELTRLTVGMEADYGRGQYCRPGGTCLDIGAASRIMATSRNPQELRDVWAGWHAVGAPMRQRYSRFVELSNKGARELGHPNTGAMWRSGYDMQPDQFEAEVERLWQQVRPLYESLHAYVRTRLVEQYGTQVVPANGMIPAHLLGNMWAQEWGNIYPLVAPRNAAGAGFDLTELIRRKGLDARGMTQYGERFFTSLGFDSLPATFWERSMLTQPRAREAVCHASAWNVNDEDDVRIKMCIEPTGEDFVTIHHELGHNFYQRAYRVQPQLFRNGAHDGFHEAIGDAIALSITPAYLKQVGLLDQVPAPAADTALLLRQAMDKVAFLPFGLMVDKWRWGVFSGQITPANYNAAWWELRNRYQGVSAPVARSEADFDPGAKYHIPANTPYMRYFLARILQFQFYRSLCRESGHTGPLYRCSFYGSEPAGAKLARMLEAGQSQPWQETLFAMTGERQMDAGAMMEYFAPLKEWLDRQNAGKPVGW
ncbi:MAG TPA: M2 family metallopeptidase [Longimicrobium sp.]